MAFLRRMTLFAFGFTLAAPLQAEWSGQFDILRQGTGSGDVYSVTVNQNGELFAAGSFVHIPGSTNATLARYVARWTLRGWKTLAGGMNGPVNCLLADGTNLYAGGKFTMAGAEPATNLACWNGTTWSSVGGGIQGLSVNALFKTNGLLYVGGSFSRAGETPVSGLAVWDGSAWSSANSSNGEIDAFYSDSSGLIVGGRFSSIGGISAANIARYNGQSWENLGTGISGTVYVLATDNQGNLYAGGGPYQPFVSQWDGQQWTALPGLEKGGNYPVNVLFYQDGTLYAGGFLHSKSPALLNGGLTRFTGTNWEDIAGSPFFRVTAGPVPYQGQLYFGGRQSAIGDPLVALWDGKQEWSSIGVSLGSPVRKMAALNGEILVAGPFSGQLLLRWNGQQWLAVDPPLAAGSFEGALCVSQGQIYTSSSDLRSVVMLNGTNWVTLGSAFPGTIKSLAFTGTNLLAGGDFGVAQFNGNDWTNLGAGVNGAVFAIASHNGNTFIGGSFSQAGGTPANNIAQWDGNTWTPLGNGVDASVSSLAFSGDDLIAGGQFTNAGPNTVNSIALWNGHEWQPLGGGVRGSPFGPVSVNALAVGDDSSIYAGGNFQNADGNVVNNLARWKGGSWTSVEGGLSKGVVSDLLWKNGQLYVGGNFKTAGDVNSPNFAIWDEPQVLLSLDIHRLSPTDLFIRANSTEVNNIFERSTNLLTWEAVTPTGTNSLLLTNSLLSPGEFFRLRSN
jgi:hypothetical protein